MIIRQTDDIAAIRNLDAICLPGCGFDSGALWWGAYHGGELIGYAGMKPSYQVGNCGYLCRAGVLPEYRGMGLHKRLIRVRIRNAKQTGWDALYTDTRQNPASANNLIECGFRMYTPDYPWGYSDACYWVFRIEYDRTRSSQ